MVTECTKIVMNLVWAENGDKMLENGTPILENGYEMVLQWLQIINAFRMVSI